MDKEKEKPCVRVPMLVADPKVCTERKLKAHEDVDIYDDFFLDGPVTRRVAVLDFDEITGELHPGIKHLPPKAGAKLGAYETNGDAGSRQMHALAVFGTVMRTISQFEHREVLGREIGWAFDAPQLLVVPRAGEMENAFYQRESHSLQFFFFQDAENHTTYGCGSRDIVAHETAHALVDGIAPGLYHTSTPQSLALHECVADMVALMSAFGSHTLAPSVLADTKGSISQPSAFSQLAEEFGGKKALRSLRNDKTLQDVSATEPHALSEVLSGALYAVVEALFEKAKQADTKPKPERALGGITSQFRRILLRALDYLPPGEISFADYGRAIIASDQAAYPAESLGRDTLMSEFLKRGIVSQSRRLAVKTNYDAKPLQGIDLDTLVDSDWAAYEFANQNRAFLGIPNDVRFRVLPRLRATRTYRRTGKDAEDVAEVVFKVSWDQYEPNKIGDRFARVRQITVGTALAINAATRQVRALLTSDHQEQTGARDALLRELAARNLLGVDGENDWIHGAPAGSAVRVEQMGGVMRVRGTARMLHVGRL
jgi:hypothetical protein